MCYWFANSVVQPFFFPGHSKPPRAAACTLAAGDGNIDYHEFANTLFPGDYEDCFQAQTEAKKKVTDARMAADLERKTPKRRDSGISFIKGAMPTAVKGTGRSLDMKYVG